MATDLLKRTCDRSTNNHSCEYERRFFSFRDRGGLPQKRAPTEKIVHGERTAEVTATRRTGRKKRQPPKEDNCMKGQNGARPRSCLVSLFDKGQNRQLPRKQGPKNDT